MASKVIPTFLLKGIDPNQVLKDYTAGLFFTSIEPKTKIQLSQDTPIIAPTYSNSDKDGVFHIRDKYNSSVVIATTGQREFEIYDKNGEPPKEGGRCEICRTDFTTRSVGYPIAYLIRNFLVEEAEPVYRNVYVFWTEGEFCSYECALRYVLCFLSKPSDFRDTTLRDSERLLRIMYALSYKTKEILRPAQDPRLLRSNGGSLTPEEWGNKKHVYVKTDRIVVLPAKTKYIRNHFCNPNLLIESADK